MTTRSMAIAAGAVVAAAVIVGAYLLGTHHRHPTSATAPGVPNSSAPPVHPSDPGLDDPVAVATAWLRAYRGLVWTDPSPSSWVDRVRPYIGNDLAAEYQQARQGTTGPDWSSFVHDHCTATVRDVGGVIPDEAPRAPDSVYVQVSGTVITTCAAGRASASPEPVAATVEVRRTPDGHWLVQRRLF